MASLMKKLLVVVFAVAIYISSCSSVDYSEKRTITYQSNLDMQSYFSLAQDAFAMEGLTVVSNGEADGTMRASKSVANEFNLDVLIQFEMQTKDVEITIVNRINKGSETIIEYYTLDDYNCDYKQYFYSAIESLKVNTTKTTFPNR